MFQRIEYKDLNSRQKENYNFQKVAGELADFGYNCLRLNDDWQGADFIACHIDGNRFLKIQLKGRMTIDSKYLGKDIYIAFLDGDVCYVYPHDTVLNAVLSLNKINSSRAWTGTKAYSWPRLSKWSRAMLEEYKV
ncbi:hypothetical protein [Hyphobacterium sp.]|uniref:hypothetical protein n=1 Tax=Hyphobacterium sp. TaxID=2004662 RepID=UPI003749B9FD